MAQDHLETQEAPLLATLVWGIMEFGLKRVHVARYGLILKQDGAIWLRITLEPSVGLDEPGELFRV